MENSTKKKYGMLITIITFIILISLKLWLKQTFELKLLGIVILVAISWTLKYFIFKKFK